MSGMRVLLETAEHRSFVFLDAIPRRGDAVEWRGFQATHPDDLPPGFYRVVDVIWDLPERAGDNIRVLLSKAEEN